MKVSEAGLVYDIKDRWGLGPTEEWHHVGMWVQCGRVFQLFERSKKTNKQKTKKPNQS